jgi:hypothetical protein
MPNPNFSGDYKDSFMSQFCDTKDVQRQEVLLCVGHGLKEGAYEETPSEYFATMFMADSFDRKLDEYDKAMWRLIDDDEQPNTVICAHRGGGKTTAMQAKMARSLCLRQSKYIMYIAATHDDAAKQTENLKEELMGNDAIHDYFGIMKTRSYDGVTKSFSSKQWFACNPANAKNNPGEPFGIIVPKSAQGRVRGRNARILGKRIRPDLILIDDLEDDEEVLNELNREKLNKWYFGALLKCVRQDQAPNPTTGRWNKPAGARANWTPPYRVFHVDTLKHHDSLMSRLLTLSSWKSVTFPAGVEIEKEEPGGFKSYTYKSLRPAFRSDAQLSREANDAMEQGTLDVFCREMLCMPAARQGATFHNSQFQHYARPVDQDIQTDNALVRVVIIDPSKSDTPSADFTGMLAVAFDPRHGKVYIRREVQERLTANQVIERAFKLAVQTNSRYVCPEKIGMEGPQKVNWEVAAAAMDMPIRLVWLGMGHVKAGDYGSGKDAIKIWRAQQIAPFYERKEIFHHIDMKGGWLEQRLLEYPRMKDYGLTDCAGYIPGVMDELGIRFDAQPKKYENVERFPKTTDNEKIKQRILTGAWAV